MFRFEINGTYHLNFKVNTHNIQYLKFHGDVPVALGLVENLGRILRTRNTFIYDYCLPAVDL